MNLFFAALLCGCVSLTTGETLTPVWANVHYTTPYRVIGGVEDGETYYVCRAILARRSGITCGKIRSSSGCIITWNGQSYRISRYDMLVTPPYASFRYQWSSSYYRGDIPSNAVECTTYSYVGRRNVYYLFYGRYKFLGNIFTPYNALYYERDGDEEKTGTYTPLMQVPRTITEYRMINVVYDFDNSIVFESEPKVATTDTTVNNLDYAVDNDVTLEYSIKTTSSWADVESYSMSVGTSLKVTAGKPLVSVEAAFEVSRTSTHQQTTSSEISETTTVTKGVTVPLRGGETVEVIVRIVEQRISVPYTADVIVVYTDGHGSWHRVEGNYISFTSYELEAEINHVD